MIDVGGRKLHLVCAGAGADGPTVVIEAGAGNDSTFWGDIVAGVSRSARVCTYDRAGLGWSDPAPEPRDFQARVEDANSVLSNAGIAGPLVLVGHSYGGYIVRWFAKMHPDKIVGVVLIDAPDELYTFDPWGLKFVEETRAHEARLGWASRSGLLRLGVKLFPERYDPMSEVPPSVRGELTALYLRSSRHFEHADEMAALQRTPIGMRNIGGFGRLGDIPLAVVSRAAQDPVTHEATQPEWLKAQQRLAALSSNSRLIVAEKSGHMIQFDQPQIIIDAIVAILNETRRTAN